MNQRNLFTVGFFAVLLVLLWQIALMFRPFLLPTVWAVILAHLMFPLHGRLTVLCRGNVTMSAALLTVGIMLLVVVPLVAMGFLLVHEAQAAQMTVAAWIQSGGIQRLPEQLAALPLMGERVQEWVNVNMCSCVANGGARRVPRSFRPRRRAMPLARNHR
ncbi:MAG: hypothetical protein KGJ14_05720, partial [Nitrospirota bacterium]|nr:hypothetical protein [Nitrospirota bacterium]